MELFESYQIIQSILHDIVHSPHGISTGEIVARYGVSRRVVPKYIGILERAGVPIYVENKRYFVDEAYHSAFTLTPEESEVLALSLQRSLSLHGSQWSVIRSLIHKLGSRMADGVANALIERFDAKRGASPADRWFSTLTWAKRKRQEVWVDYHPLNRAEPTRWRIKPYQFFANPFSDGLYVLCDGTRDGENYIPLSLKFDRILDVHPTDLRFRIVDQARFASREGRAWGVWSSEQHPVRVVLRFLPQHYDRLLESVWHPSQRLSIDHNGDVFFAVEVTEPREMIPWIRSWGSGVVVIEPDALRRAMIEDLRRVMDAYGITATTTSVTASSPLYLLWAKYDRRTQQFHPLLYHLLDVAAVAWTMWTHILSESQRRWLMDVLNADESYARSLFAFLAGLHDIGKATPTFQSKAQPIYQQLTAAGLPHEPPYDVQHGVHSAVILNALLPNLGVDKRAAKLLASVIGGHHGRWIDKYTINRLDGTSGEGAWAALQAALFEQLRQVVGVEEVKMPSDTMSFNTVLTVLSGFVSVCDWVGSHEGYFSYQTALIDLADYFEGSLVRAETALTELGWYRWRSPRTRHDFTNLFGFAPNPMQQAVIAAFQTLSAPPRLILIEYLTGGGKTEIALYLTDLLINLYGLGGAYIAMPTQATSNQMFERASRFLQARYPDHRVNLQLAHAQADLHPLFAQFRQHVERDGNESGLTAEQWFHNRKRTLLAPFAVGTVDQVMLSVLRVHHHFVRLHALSHKVMVFDEIHSYDTYMNEIIERLLEWLAALHTPTILLSATLPAADRLRLTQSFGASDERMPDVPYPRLTIVSADGRLDVRPLPRPESRTLHVQHIADDPAEWGDMLANVYAQGGCIAVICNTVDEAIRVCQHLRGHSAIDAQDVILFHARFPAAWRGEIERDVLDAFGRDGNRPARAILVATQIVEQSLDLDFDLILTQYAPIDLLIQRAGRLHRHPRQRPAHLAAPVLMIRAPVLEHDGVPTFGVDEAIYQRFILLKTWHALRSRTELRIPDDLDALMNAVYDRSVQVDGATEAFNHALAKAHNDMTLHAADEEFRGAQYRISTPASEDLIGKSDVALPDDEHVITTRDIRPGVDIICMGSDPDGPLPVAEERPPTADEVRWLLQFRVSVQKAGLVDALKKLPLNPQWERIPALRFARKVDFEKGEFVVPATSYRLRLSRANGLEYIEENT